MERGGSAFMSTKNWWWFDGSYCRTQPEGRGLPSSSILLLLCGGMPLRVLYGSEVFVFVIAGLLEELEEPAISS